MVSIAWPNAPACRAEDQGFKSPTMRQLSCRMTTKLWMLVTSGGQATLFAETWGTTEQIGAVPDNLPWRTRDSGL